MNKRIVEELNEAKNFYNASQIIDFTDKEIQQKISNPLGPHCFLVLHALELFLKALIKSTSVDGKYEKTHDFEKLISAVPVEISKKLFIADEIKYLKSSELKDANLNWRYSFSYFENKNNHRLGCRLEHVHNIAQKINDYLNKKK